MRQVLALPSQLGPLLKAARKEAGLSQQKLAERVGISQSRMSHMELNPGSVSLEQLLQIFAVLQLEVVVGTRQPVVSASANQVMDAFMQVATGVVKRPEW